MALWRYGVLAGYSSHKTKKPKAKKPISNNVTLWHSGVMAFWWVVLATKPKSQKPKAYF